jgi:hypothetical protein
VASAEDQVAAPNGGYRPTATASDCDAVLQLIRIATDLIADYFCFLSCQSMGTQARRLSVRCGVSARQQPAWMVPERTDRQAAIRSSQGATVGLPGSRRGS